MDEISVNHAVAEWFAGDKTMFDACTNAPEVAWSAILIILQRDLSYEEKARLVGGPLETLLSLHGLQFIDRVAKQERKIQPLIICWEAFGKVGCRQIEARKRVWS